MASDSPSAKTPRTTGRRAQRCLSRNEEIGRLTSAISPSGLRTATDHADGPRIITPSRTAWPPMGALTAELLTARRRGGAGLLEAALEPLDAAARVHELLLARVEGMALGADLDMKLGLGGAGLERVPAGARDGREDVLGMDVGLHESAWRWTGLRIPEAVSRPRCRRRRPRPPSRPRPRDLPGEERGHPGGPGGLRGELRALVEEAEAGLDLLLGDEDRLDAELEPSRTGASPRRAR